MHSHIYTLLLVIAAASALPLEKENYHVKLYDYSALPTSEIEGMIDCIMHGTSCNNVSEGYRAIYPAVLITACELCTTEQKKAGYSFYNRTAKDLPHKLEEFKRVFDPEGKYYDRFYNAFKASALGTRD